MAGDDRVRQRITAGCVGLGLAVSEPGVRRLVQYSRLVMRWRRVVNLTAASSAEEFAAAHVVDCLAASALITGKRVLDVGSGAGLPGVVLAIARPEADYVLLDSRQRRVRFLTQVQIELALPNVEVVHARVEAYVPDYPFDTIVCRAYGPIARFVRDTRGLHHPSCRLVALKGVAPDLEVAALGGDAGACAVHRITVPAGHERHIVVVDCVRLGARGEGGTQQPEPG